MNQSSVNQELESEAGKLERYRARQKILKPYNRRSSFPSFASLRDAYNQLISLLNCTYPECVVKTESENRVFQALSCATNLKFERSFWVVNRNVDLFCPAIGVLHPPILKGQKISREPLMRGFAIEVDGPIHDSLSKSRKDETKYRFLHDLRIGLSVIENGDLYEPTVRSVIDNPRKFQRLDTRARQLLLRKIYISTIAFHADDETLSVLFGLDFNGLTEISE